MPMGADEVTTPILEPGRIVAGYTILEELGSGAMSAVYSAQGPDGAEVALKVIRSDAGADSSGRRRFERESALAERVDHPNVLSAVAHGEDDGWIYLALPFHSGGSLADRLEAGPLPVADVARTIADIGAGLDSLHRLGFVHRDVKPANVLLAPSGAILADFGVARGEDASVLTRAGSIVGTADYLAPETIRGEPAGPLADIYALGCVAYASTVGTPPFADRPTIVDVCRAHLEDPPPDPADRRPDLPAAFVSSLLSALAKEPADRPGTGTAYGLLLRAGARGA